jgi:aryl carrier-like protein
MGSYHNVTSQKSRQASSGWSELKDFLTRATNEPDKLNEKSSEEYLAREIGKKIFNFIMRSEEDMDISLSLAQAGLDSLIAIELRRWWKQMFGVGMSILEIMNCGTISGLGAVAAERLRKRLAEAE